MTCVICKHGETRPGTTTMTLERENTTVVFKHVPAEVCQNYNDTSLAPHLRILWRQTMKHLKEETA